MLVLGAAAPASAENIYHKGRLHAKQTCDDGAEVNHDKLKAKITGFKIAPLPFPSFDLTVDIDGFSQLTGSGVVATKNQRVAEFHAEVSNADDQQFYFTGKAIVDHKSEDRNVIKTEGKIFGIDHGSKCIYVGKFRTKTDPHPIIFEN
jgi:hypothetical protein